jgi:hypothetical protein
VQLFAVSREPALRHAFGRLPDGLLAGKTPANANRLRRCVERVAAARFWTAGSKSALLFAKHL